MCVMEGGVVCVCDGGWRDEGCRCVAWQMSVNGVEWA